VTHPNPYEHYHPFLVDERPECLACEWDRTGGWHPHGKSRDWDKPLAPARGIVICFLIGVALWAVVIAVWSLFR
jgi:hypothetical protein